MRRLLRPRKRSRHALPCSGVPPQEGCPYSSSGSLNPGIEWGLRAAVLPSGFQESVVFSGLTSPTAVRFAPDGRVFVAEQNGLIKVFDSLTATTPTVFADLSTNVFNSWDRGLLGLALDPNFPTKPYEHVLYTYDAPIGGTAPRAGYAGRFCRIPARPARSPGTPTGCVVQRPAVAPARRRGAWLTGPRKQVLDRKTGASGFQPLDRAPSLPSGPDRCASASKRRRRRELHLRRLRTNGESAQPVRRSTLPV